jgi:hypothetical protein
MRYVVRIANVSESSNLWTQMALASESSWECFEECLLCDDVFFSFLGRAKMWVVFKQKNSCEVTFLTNTLVTHTVAAKYWLGWLFREETHLVFWGLWWVWSVGCGESGEWFVTLCSVVWFSCERELCHSCVATIECFVGGWGWWGEWFRLFLCTTTTFTTTQHSMLDSHPCGVGGVHIENLL